MIKDPQAMHGGWSWCQGVMLMNTHCHADADTYMLDVFGGGGGCIPVIDINGLKSPELTF